MHSDRAWRVLAAASVVAVSLGMCVVRAQSLLGNQQPPIDKDHWYYCPSTWTYYPWVPVCNAPWQIYNARPGEPMPPQPREPQGLLARGYGGSIIWQQQMSERAAEYQIRKQDADRATEANKVYAVQAAKDRAARAVDEKNGYKYMSVSDFDLDKRTFPTGTKVILKGWFREIGDIDWMVANPGIDSSPRVGLISDDAPRSVRSLLQTCRMMRICSIKISGRVGGCEHSYLGVAYKTDRCLYVDGTR